MKTTILCSGSKGNSTLVQTENTSILIDCGASTKRYQMDALKEAGVELADLSALLVTHSHGDHIKQLRHFASVPVYACCPLHVKTPKGEPVDLDIHPVRFGEKFTIGDFQIYPIPLSHDSGPTMGFVIHADGEILVYITDTGYVSRDNIEKIRGADYYILESNHDIDQLMQTNRPVWLKQRITADTGHLCNEDCALVLSKIITDKTKEIVLAHLSEEANTPELALAALDKRLHLEQIDKSRLHIQAASQYESLTFGH